MYLNLPKICFFFKICRRILRRSKTWTIERPKTYILKKYSEGTEVEKGKFLISNSRRYQTRPKTWGFRSCGVDFQKVAESIKLRSLNNFLIQLKTRNFKRHFPKVPKRL